MPDLEARRAAAELAGNPIMKYFVFAHLPERVQRYSIPWCVLACEVTESIPASAERTVALRKLLEGKDAAVRAAL